MVGGTIGTHPAENECCYAQSSSWWRYDPQSTWECQPKDGYNYHLPEDATSSDAQFAEQCLTNGQQRRISNPSNGYFLLTEASINNCYFNPTECRKFIMVCIKDDPSTYSFVLFYLFEYSSISK